MEGIGIDSWGGLEGGSGRERSCSGTRLCVFEDLKIKISVARGRAERNKVEEMVMVRARVSMQETRKRKKLATRDMSWLASVVRKDGSVYCSCLLSLRRGPRHSFLLRQPPETGEATVALTLDTFPLLSCGRDECPAWRRPGGRFRPG